MKIENNKWRMYGNVQNGEFEQVEVESILEMIN